MGCLLSRPVEIRTSNKTLNVTLNYHRGHWSPPLNPELPPGSSDSCQIFGDLFALDTEQLLVYEAESFSLAVFASISLKSNRVPNVLRLELSLDKAHLGDLDRTFSRMITPRDAPDTDKTSASRCKFSGRSEGFVQLSAGPYKVTATVSHCPRSVLEVKLEERGRSDDDLAHQEPVRCWFL